MKELGLSQKLLSSVGDVLKSSSQKRVEQTAEQATRLSAHYTKMVAKPLSAEETKLAAESARAPQKRIFDSISQVYAKSVAETKEQAQKDAEYINRQYSKAGAVAPISEAKVVEPKGEEPASKDIKGKSMIDPFAKATLKSRKAKAQADVSDSVQLEGEVIDEAEGTTPKTPREKALAAKADPKDKITHKDVMVARGAVKEDNEAAFQLSAEELARIEQIAKDFDTKAE